MHASSADWDLFFYFVFDYTNYVWSFTSLKHLSIWRDVEIYLMKSYHFDSSSLSHVIQTWTVDQRKMLDARGLRIARLNARPDKSYDLACEQRFMQWIQDPEWCKHAVHEMIPRVITNMLKGILTQYETVDEGVVFSSNVEECDAFDLHQTLLPLERSEVEETEASKLKIELDELERKLDLREMEVDSEIKKLEKKEALFLRVLASMREQESLYQDIGIGGYYTLSQNEE